MKSNAPKRILFVDDDRLILKVLSDFLTFQGFDVVVAENGEQALEKITLLPPDIILLDISMPGMGGIGLLKRLTADNGAIKFPVLVFTARTTTEDYFRGIPIDGFITKPCDKSELVSKIQEILEKHKRANHKTILIGENDLMVADQLVKVFRSAGFEIDEAATGPEILEKAAVCLPDIILMKQILTGMNGDSVASVLHAMPRTQSIPIVLYDASSVAKGKAEEDLLKKTTGIKKYLVTEDAVALLNAVNDVLGRLAPYRAPTAAGLMT